MHICLISAVLVFCLVVKNLTVIKTVNEYFDDIDQNILFMSRQFLSRP